MDPGDYPLGTVWKTFNRKTSHNDSHRSEARAEEVGGVFGK
jgi:hypothetical protein